MNMTKRLAGLLVGTLISLSGPALATGPTDQGTLVAGQGLDWERSGTELQVLPPLIPPTAGSGKPFTVYAASLVVGSCTPVSNLVQRCSITATLQSGHQPAQLCGHWLGSTSQQIWMYVLNGKPDGTGAFTLGTNDQFLACSVTDPARPNPWEWTALGAVGKCMLWPRPPPKGMGFIPSSGNTNEFNTCVRAVRADYCGMGVTHTIDGTQIDLYNVVPPPPHTSTAPFVLEAWWKETGAICVLHARWLVLSPQCQGRFSVVLGSGERGVKEYTGAEYHCDPTRVQLPPAGTCLSPPDLIRGAMRGAILADDSKLE